MDLFEDKALPGHELLKAKHYSKSKDKRFLLVLDNCEALIEHEGEQLRNLLTLFQDQCKMLKILVVSRNELGTYDMGEQI